jgi:hypothetical protein
MNRSGAILLTAVVVVSGGVSFVATRLAAVGPQKVERAGSVQWLSVAPSSVVELERSFNEQANALIATLLHEQKNLATAIEDPCTPDAAILAQVETVIGAHESLLRQVGEHIAALRLELPAGQREHLMDLCAQTIRGPLIRAGGGGRGFGGGSRMGPRDGSGAGRGYGYGGGSGYGRGRRLAGGLAQYLRLTDEQIRIGQEQDPEFETDSASLRDALLGERAKLLAIFENPATTNDDLLEQLDKLILTHSQIERRVARHVLILRPHLTADQQKWLIGLCQRAHASPAAGQE